MKKEEADQMSETIEFDRLVAGPPRRDRALEEDGGDRMLSDLDLRIRDYEHHEHVYWRLSSEQRTFVDQLIGFRKSMRRLRIVWPFNPSIARVVDWRVTTPIIVECRLGDVHATARIAPQEFPLSKDKQDRIEHALKTRCLQTYVDHAETVVEVTDRPAAL